MTILTHGNARAGIHTAMFVVLLTAGDLWALGDVQVSVASGKLSIVGDEAPNSIQVLPGVGPGAFVVIGVDGTAVNGAISAMVSDVRKLSIETHGGVDLVELIDVVLDETLSVNLADGSDTFLMQGGRVAKKAKIKGGNDGDEIRIRQGTRFGGPLLVNGGKKTDTIVVNDASIGGDSEIKAGGGNDTITVQFTTLDGGANCVVAAGDGNDDVILLETRFDDVQVYLGPGDDNLRVEGCDFNRSVRAEGNDGHDVLDLDGDNTFDLREPRKVTGFEDVD